jgi:hypothetical protein
MINPVIKSFAFRTLGLYPVKAWLAGLISFSTTRIVTAWGRVGLRRIQLGLDRDVT